MSSYEHIAPSPVRDTGGVGRRFASVEAYIGRQDEMASLGAGAAACGSAIALADPSPDVRVVRASRDRVANAIEVGQPRHAARRTAQQAALLEAPCLE